MDDRRFLLTRQSGFTLAELLVAMAVASVVMVMVVATYYGQTTTSSNQQQMMDMQQNLRAALYTMSQDIMLAGYKRTPSADVPATFGIITATATELAISYLDEDDTVETVRYRLYDSGGDGDMDLGRLSTEDPAIQPFADNIETMEFFYTFENDPPATNVAAGDLRKIRSVGISILGRTANPVKGYIDQSTYMPLSGPSLGTVWGSPAYNDRFRRQLLTATVFCRNSMHFTNP